MVRLVPVALLAMTAACATGGALSPSASAHDADPQPCPETGTRGDVNAMEGAAPAAPIPVPSGIELSASERARPCRATRNDVVARSK